MARWLLHRLNFWVILVALLVAVGLVILFAVLVLMLPAPAALEPTPAVAMTIIPAPTPTPTRPTLVATPTSTSPPSIGGISIGSYVQISGTGGQGLRIRSGPGTSNPPRFLGMDAEVFQVMDGPKMADDFTWWYLEAPYDPARSGWAASSYLSVVNSPTETP
jgi:hypothetical protein